MEETSPADMLALAQRQRQHTEQELFGHPGVLVGAWGTAWLLGFGLLFLTIGPSPAVDVPLGVSLGVFYVLLAAAGVVTFTRLRRACRGVRGPNRTGAAMFGWAWLLGFVALAAVITAITSLGVSNEVYALLWSTGPGLLVGVLFLTGGAMHQDWFQYGLGSWMLLIDGIGAFTGIPGHYLVMSLAGGGVMVLAAGVLSVTHKHPRSPGVLLPTPGTDGV